MSPRTQYAGLLGAAVERASDIVVDTVEVAATAGVVDTAGDIGGPATTGVVIFAGWLSRCGRQIVVASSSYCGLVEFAGAGRDGPSLRNFLKSASECC